MAKPLAGILALFIMVGLPLLLFWLAYARKNKVNRETQRHLSDRDLLRMLRDEPDQLLSPHQLRDKTEMSLNESRSRLNTLSSYGILERSNNSRGRHFFGPRTPVEEPPELELSPDPFLTVEDLLQIFKAHDYKVTAQQMIMATGLPLAVIKRELKYFEKQKIVQKLHRSDAQGMVKKRFFVLQDPYRSDPERFRARAGQLDLELKEILTNENLIV